MRSLPYVSEITETWSRSGYRYIYCWNIVLRSTSTFGHYLKGKIWIGRAALIMALVAIGLVLFDAPASATADDSPECPVMAITRSRGSCCFIRVSRKLSSEATWSTPTCVGPLIPLQSHTPEFQVRHHDGCSPLTSSLPLRC